MKNRHTLVAALAAFAALPRFAAADALDTSAFDKHVTFTVSADWEGGALENFPVLVRLSDVAGFTLADFSTPADELRFADSEGTNLDYEIDTWDAASSTALVWVSLPAFDAGATITAYWAPTDASALPAVSPAAVWTKADYVGVWHMNVQNADGSYPDSTGLGATLAPNGTGTPSAPATDSPSALGSAYYVVPKNDKAILQVSAAKAANWKFSSTGYSTETWIGNLTANFHRIFCHASSSGNSKNSLALGQSQIYQMVGSWSNKSWPSGSPSGTAWHHITSVLAPSDGSFGSEVYDHGVGFFAGTQKAVDFNDDGMLVTARSDSQWNHWMDEIRVRRGNTTAAWAAANYATQADADFLSAGSIEVSGGVIPGATTVTATTWTTVSATAEFTVPASFGTVPVTATLSTNGTVAATVAATSVDETDGTSTATFADVLPGTAYSVQFVASPDGAPAAYSTAAAATTEAISATVNSVGDNAVTVSGDFTIPQSEVYGAATVRVRSVGVVPVEFSAAAGTAATGDLSVSGVEVSGLDIATDSQAWIEIARADGSVVSTPAVQFTTTGFVVVDAGDFDHSVTFRVAGYTGSETLENFPALVRLSPETSGFDYDDCAPSGSDLRFAVDGVRVPHEIETWNPGGESLVWVQIPEMQANSYFTMYFGVKSGHEAPAADNPARVWTKADYIAVYHMDEKSAGAFADASGVSGAVAAPSGFNDPVTDDGIVGGYVVGNGALTLDPAVTYGWDFAENGVTFEAWMTPSKGNYRRMFSNGSTWNGWNTMSIGTGNYYIGSGNSTGGGPRSWAAAGWNHMSFAYRSSSASAASRSALAYDNGTSGAGTTLAKDLTFENGLAFTSYIDGTAAMDGNVDEIRIRARCSSADWALATYQTMALPGFVAVDAAQPESIRLASASATAASVEGTFYAPGGASIAVAYAEAGGRTTNVTEAVTLAAGATAATVAVSGLSAATDYVAWFVMNGDAFPETAVEFTTDGSPAVDQSAFGRKATFRVGESFMRDDVQYDFPVLVRLSEERVPGFFYRHCAEGGSDIRFVGADGRLLASDVENWDPDGESLVWVNLPECRAGTEFYMLFAAARSAKLPSSQASYVWTRAGYLGVWHMGKVNADFTLDSPVAGMDATLALGENFPAPTSDDRGVTKTQGAGNGEMAVVGTEEAVVSAPAGLYAVGTGDVKLSAAQTSAWDFESDGATFELWCLPISSNLVTGVKTSASGRFFASGTGWSDCQNINIDGSWCHQVWHWTDENGADKHAGDQAPSAFGSVYSENARNYVVKYDLATGDPLDYGWSHVTVAYEPNPYLEEQAVRYKNGEAWPVRGDPISGAGISNFPNGMGLIGWVNGGEAFGGPVDELRIRQGVSTPEWTKAVYLSMADAEAVTGFAPEGTLFLLR